MRVCLLTNNTRGDNGWGRFAREYTAALRKRGIAVVVLSEEERGLPGEHVVLSGALRFSLHSLPWSLLHLPLLMRAALRARAYAAGCDIIHALDGYPYGVIAGMMAFGLRKPFCVTLQGTYALDAFHHFFEGKFIRWALNAASKVTCISSSTAEGMKKRMPDRNITVVGHGTTPLWISSPKSAGSPPVPQPYLLTVGTIKPHKGYRVSLEAFAHVKKKFPKLSYAIVGYQGHRHFAEIGDLAGKLGVRDSVHFFTNLTDMDLLRLYDHAELFLLTPVSSGTSVEGFGLVYREAGARCLAVIGSKNCGAEDAVKDGVTGILCAQGDVNAVTAAIEKLLGDPALRSHMAKEGRRVAERETWDYIAAKYVALYESILKKRTC